MADYGLHDRAIEVPFPAEVKRGFPLVSGDYPASCPVGTGGPSPGCKTRPGRDTDHSPPSSSDVMNKYELYLLYHLRVVGLIF